MKGRQAVFIIRSGVFLLCLLVAGGSALAAKPSDPSDKPPKLDSQLAKHAQLGTGESRVIIEFEDGAPEGFVTTGYGAKLGRRLRSFKGTVALVPNRSLEALSRNPLIRRVHWDRPTGGELLRIASLVGARAVQQYLGLDGAGVGVAISDPGITTWHDDLAGANGETTLGVTVDGIEAAPRHSFTSSFNERVFLYKKEHGFQTNEPRIAVIVQQQVDADSAGVAFSLNPLNNCFDEAVINANHGLGESVVVGAAIPEIFVVDKTTHQILEVRVGSKQAIIRLNQAGGTDKSIRENHQETSITNEQALALTYLLQKVESYYQKPVDIEWAIAGGKIYLLQARPITTYRPLPAEMVTAPGEPKRLYANSTLIEQGLQDPLSVLGTDFLIYVLNKVGGPIGWLHRSDRGW